MVHEVLRYSEMLAMLCSHHPSAAQLEKKRALHEHLFIQGNAIIFDFLEQQFPSFSLYFDVLPKSVELIDETNKRAIVRSSAYLAMRDQVWKESKAQLGDGLWNGKLLTVTRIRIGRDVLSIFVRECEYKDIMLKRKFGPTVLQERLSSDVVTDAYFHTCTVPWVAHCASVGSDSAVLTRKAMKSAVVGRIGTGTINKNGTLSFIGGTLNTDEFTIQTFDDVKSVSVQELYEEAHISDVKMDDLQLMSLNYREDRGSIHTLFSVSVSEYCINDFVSNDELSEIFLYEEQQFLETKEPLAFNIVCFLKCLSMS